MRKGSLIFLLLVVIFLPGCNFNFEAPEGTLTIGAEAPKLRTKMVNDVGGDLSRLTSYRHPDARMYEYSIDDALSLGKPVVLEFATPGHCTVCDKQLQMLKALNDKYGKEVIFVHLDQYMNPEAFIAFRVKGDPWTFVIDSSGKVSFRQAGRLLYGELDSVLQKVTQSSKKG